LEPQEKKAQAEEESENPELVAGAFANIARLGSTISAIMKYAIENLPRLIFDENGNVVWPEAASMLDEALKDYDLNSLTNEQYETIIVMVVDQLINTRSFDDLDKVLLKLPTTLRVLVVSPAFALASTFVNAHPELKPEFLDPKKWDALYKAFVENNGDLAFMKKTLLNAKNLEEWMRQYVVHKLKIQP
jgi:hypothetical protein